MHRRGNVRRMPRPLRAPRQPLTLPGFWLPPVRWANRHKGAAEAVEVLARLVAIERALTALARFESPDDDDAH